MIRQGTVISAMKSQIIDSRTSTLFVQTLYESDAFNAKKDTSDILNDFFNKNAYMNCEPGISNTKFRKEKMNKTRTLGRSAAKIFTGTKLVLKDN